MNRPVNQPESDSEFNLEQNGLEMSVIKDNTSTAQPSTGISVTSVNRQFGDEQPSATRLRVSPKLKNQIRIAFGGLYLAGAIYWMSRLFLKHQGEFGPEPSVIENWAGPIHLIFAFFFFGILGVVWTMHIAPALRTRRNRWTGWLFMGWVAVLGFSGIGIIYGRESLVTILEQIHPWCGALMLPTLVVHWLRRR